MKAFLPQVSLVLISLSVSITAFAHAHLTHAVPAEASLVAALPTKMVLTFSEPLETLLSKVEVKNAKTGEFIQEGKPSTSDPQARSLEVALKAVTITEPTEFLVNWKIVSKDSHRMQGSYAFKAGPSKSTQ